MPPNVGVPPSRRPWGCTTPIPLRVGQLWELEPQVLLTPALAPHPGTLTGPIGNPTCSPSFKWGPHIFVALVPHPPPLHTHMKALHTHLHPHGSLHTLMLLCSQSYVPLSLRTSLPPPLSPRPPPLSPRQIPGILPFVSHFTFNSSHIPCSAQSLSGLWVTLPFPLTCISWPHVVVLPVAPALSLMNTH